MNFELKNLDSHPWEFASPSEPRPAYAGRTAGSYVYEPDSGRFVRVSDGVSSYALGGGPLPDGYLMWDTPVGKASDPQEPIPGATQWLVRWRS